MKEHNSFNQVTHEELLAGFPDAVLIHEQRIVTFANPVAETLFRAKPQELLGKNILELVAPSDFEFARERLSKRELGESVPHRIELTCRRMDGSLVQTELISTPVVSPKKLGVIGVLKDITAHKNLLEQRDYFFDHSADCMAVLNMEGEYLRVNPACIKTFGIAEAEMVGSRFNNLIHPEDLPIALDGFKRLTQSRDPVYIEVRCCHANGSQFWLGTLGIYIQSQELVFAIGRDITDSKQLLHNLQTACESADKAAKIMSDFLSRLSHEVRTPLNAILGFAQLLERGSLSEDSKDNVSQILGAGRHLSSLIDDILDITRIEGGSFTISLEPIALDQSIAEAIDLVNHLASERNITIHEYIPDNAIAKANSRRLRQVLVNLLSNAVKYNTQAGDVWVRCELSKADSWRISIADTGKGIDTSLQARVFSAFDRLGAEHSEIDGTGIGLALAKGLIERMNGRIGFTSTPGEGSTFWIEIPKEQGNEDYPIDFSDDHAPDSLVFPGNGALLYIEDHQTNRQLIETLVGQLSGISLHLASTAKDGLELGKLLAKSADSHLRLILLDVHLPDMDGHELLRLIRAEDDLVKIPVVVLTADATPQTRERLLSAGAMDFLTKPLDVNRFLEVLRRLWMK